MFSLAPFFSVSVPPPLPVPSLFLSGPRLSVPPSLAGVLFLYLVVCILARVVASDSRGTLAAVVRPP